MTQSNIPVDTQYYILIAFFMALAVGVPLFVRWVAYRIKLERRIREIYSTDMGMPMMIGLKSNGTGSLSPGGKTQDISPEERISWVNAMKAFERRQQSPPGETIIPTPSQSQPISRDIIERFVTDHGLQSKYSEESNLLTIEDPNQLNIINRIIGRFGEENITFNIEIRGQKENSI